MADRDPGGWGRILGPHERGVTALADLLKSGADGPTVLAAAVLYIDRFAASINGGEHILQLGERRSATMLLHALRAAGLPTEYVPPVPKRVGPDPDLDLRLNLDERALYRRQGRGSGE